MSKIQIHFFKSENIGNLALKKLDKKILAVVLNKKTLSLIFIDGSKKSISLKDNQKDLLSKEGKLYEYSEDGKNILSVIPIKLI